MGYRFDCVVVKNHLTFIYDLGTGFRVNFYGNCIGLLRKFYGNGSVLSNTAQCIRSVFPVY